MHQNDICKIVILEKSDAVCNELKSFFDENNLIMLRVKTEKNLLKILEYNLNIGAICMNISTGEGSMLQEIKKNRTDVPVILYGPDEKPDPESIPDAELFEGYFPMHDEYAFVALSDVLLFSRHYPIELVKGIHEITMGAIASMLKNTAVTPTVPYLDYDKKIDGELTSLMTIDSNWGRGYTMLQIDAGSFDALLHTAGKTLVQSEEIERFRSVLGELTNVIWGGFKTRFAGGEHDKHENRIQLPILINHKESYIFFGETIPCLSFKYLLKDADNTPREIVLYQKFIFNLIWNPEMFQEQSRQEKELVKSGILEML